MSNNFNEVAPVSEADGYSENEYDAWLRETTEKLSADEQFNEEEFFWIYTGDWNNEPSNAVWYISPEGKATYVSTTGYKFKDVAYDCIEYSKEHGLDEDLFWNTVRRNQAANAKVEQQPLSTEW